MPLFEYQCRTCSCVFEVLRSRREHDAEPGCPDCGGNDVVRAWSSFSGQTRRPDGCSTTPGRFG